MRDQIALCVFHLSLVEGQRTAGYNVPRVRNDSNLEMNCALLWLPAIIEAGLLSFCFFL